MVQKLSYVWLVLSNRDLDRERCQLGGVLDRDTFVSVCVWFRVVWVAVPFVS